MQFWAVKKSNANLESTEFLFDVFLYWQLLKKQPVETTKGQMSFVFPHISTDKERECCTICMV